MIGCTISTALKLHLWSRLLSILSLALVVGCSGVPKSAPNEDGTSSGRSTEPGQASSIDQGEPTAPVPIREPNQPVPDGIRLRFRPEKGKTWKYVLRSDVTISFDEAYLRPGDAQDVKTSFDVGFEVDVRDVAQEVRTIRFVSGPIKLESGGQSPPQQVELKIDERGRPLTIPSGILAGLLLVGILPFPESGLKTGSTWSATSVRSSVAGDAEIEESYTLVGREKRHGRDAYRIRMMSTSPDRRIAMEGNYFVDVVDGMLLSAEVTQKASTDRAFHPTRGELPASITAKTVVTIQDD